MPDLSSKASLRQKLLSRRDSIPYEVRRVKSRLIRERLVSLEEITKADVIFTFASFRSEVDTGELIQNFLLSGKRVALPKVDRENHVLLLCEIKAIEELSPGYMGIPEPSAPDAGQLLSINDVDAVIIPGAGFDLSGSRIGYGGGYYDRLLAGIERPLPVVAPAYEEQLVETVPSEPHDIRVGIIVTDRRIIPISPS